MDRADRALVDETKALISEVESGNTDHAAWVAIQDRVVRLYDGRTMVEVGQLLDKGQHWVGKVLKWDGSSRSRYTPFGGADQQKARTKHQAKKALRDPEQRKQVLEELTGEEAGAVVSEIFAIEDAKGDREERDARAMREENYPEDANNELRQLVTYALRKSNKAIKEGIKYAKQAGWKPHETELLEARIEVHEGLVELLKMAVNNSHDIDWDAELLRLTQEEGSEA